MMRTIVRQKASKLVMKTHLCKKHLEFQATSFSRTILSYPEVFTFYRSHCSCTWLALRSRQSAVKRETNIHYYQEQEQVGRTRCDRLTPRTTVFEKEKKSNNNSCQASLGTSSFICTGLLLVGAITFCFCRISRLTLMLIAVDESPRTTWHDG